MANVVDKLREFFGDPTIPGQTIEEFLDAARAKGITPGGGGSGGSNGGTLYCNMTVDTQTGNGVLDKSYADISAAVEAGKAVYCKLSAPSGSSGYSIMQLGGYAVNNGVYAVVFFLGDTTYQVTASSETDMLTYSIGGGSGSANN